MRALEVHGTFDVFKWGLDSRGFAPGANRRQTRNLPNPGGENCPSGGGNGTAKGKRGYCTPMNVWKLQSLRNQMSSLMLWVPLLIHPKLQSPMVTHPRKQEILWGLNPKAQQPPSKWHQSMGLGIHKEEWGDTKLLARILVPLPHRCQDPQWMGGAVPGEKASCGLPATQSPTWKEQLVEHSALSGWVEARRFPPSTIPGLSEHQGLRQDEMWHWLGPSRGMLCNHVLLQGDFVEPSKTSVGVKHTSLRWMVC